MHILIAYVGTRVTDICKFLLTEYAMFQKFAHAPAIIFYHTFWA